MVHPLVGLYAAIIVGFITSMFGGRPYRGGLYAGSLAVPPPPPPNPPPPPPPPTRCHLVMEHGALFLSLRGGDRQILSAYEVGALIVWCPPGDAGL